MTSAILLFASAIVAEPLRPGDHSRKLTVEGRERSYLVHIPPSYDPKKPTPLVLAYHGGGGNADSMVRFSGLNTKY